MNNDIYIPQQDYAVLCRCMTYNHSMYIEDTLNGFAIQQTSFPFVCLVVDDCSTDGEQCVINAWLERECDMSEAEFIDIPLSNIVLVKHKSNPNCSFAIYFLKKNLYKDRLKKNGLTTPWNEHSKYVATCEGDDFWVDKNKLQKQYEFLDNNSNYSFVYTGFHVVSQNGNIQHVADMEDRMKRSHSGILFFDLLVNMNHIMTVTMFYRSKVLKDVLPFYYDYGVFLTAARQGLACYLPECTSCYRNNPTSFMNTAPKSLFPKLYKIVNVEVNRCLDYETTSNIIKEHNMCKKVLAYICVRYIKKSTCRLEYLKTLLRHPSLWLHAIEGVLIRVFGDEKFRNSLKEI